jgi:hypothetical protein
MSPLCDVTYEFVEVLELHLLALGVEVEPHVAQVAPLLLVHHLLCSVI